MNECACGCGGRNVSRAALIITDIFLVCCFPIYTKFTALAALADKVQFEAAAGNEAAQQVIVDHLKTLVGSHANDPWLLLIAAQVLWSAGQTKEALQCVSSSHAAASTHLELMITALQIYLKLDRLDLARQQLQAMKQADEDGILTQLASVYVSLALGTTGAADAVHLLNALSEQYGYSVYLLNLTACALMQQGDYAAAEQKLDECLREYQASPEVPPLPDTYINAICCSVQQSKSPVTFLQQLQQLFPRHAYCAGWERVVAAFDREAVKYKV